MPDPASQVAAALSAMIGSTGGAATAATVDRGGSTAVPGAMPTTLTSAETNASAPLRTLTIQLEPEHLGTVSIHLRLTGDKLDIQIGVADRDALDLLARDRHILAAAVSAAGHDASALSLSSPQADGDGPAGGMPRGESGSAGLQGSTDAFASSSGAGAGRSGDRDAGRPSRGSAADSDAPATTAPAVEPEDGLYV